MGRSRCTMTVQGLDCPVEAAALRDALGGTAGVDRLDFDLIHGTMTVHFDDEAASPAELLRRITTGVGMKASLVDSATPVEERRGGLRPWLPTIEGGLLLVSGFGLSRLGIERAAIPAYFLVILLAGLDLFPKAVRALRRRQLDIHVLMGLAIVGAIALGQWEEAATVAFLFGLSESLEALSLNRARSAIRALLEVEPDRAERITADGSVGTIAAGEVLPGDRVRVRAGARIPVDGTITCGRSSVDQKAITGESKPVTRETGDEVFAGTVNGDGALEVVATSALGDALISRIIERVRAAQANRTPIEQSINRFAEVYTPIVVALAVAFMVVPPAIRLMMGLPPEWATWVGRGLIALVVACPCALVIATPVAVASALASAARRGILIKGGSYLEEFGRLRVLAFDKTGTLTRVEPDVVEVVASSIDGGDQ
ncbi:MAG TPA: HAD-IC family P-type ATPase, partial [Isosphaeraceae bacterium]